MKNVLSGFTAQDAKKHALKVREIIESKKITQGGIEHINKLASLVEDHGNGYFIVRTSGGKIDMTLVHAMNIACEEVFGSNLTDQYMAMEIRASLRELSQTKQSSKNLSAFVNSLAVALT